MYPPSEVSERVERIRAHPAGESPEEAESPPRRVKYGYAQRPATQASAWPLLGACGRVRDGCAGLGARTPSPRRARAARAARAAGAPGAGGAPGAAPPPAPPPGALELPGVANRQEAAAASPPGALGLPGVASRREAPQGEAEGPPSYVTESVTTPAARVQPRPVPLASWSSGSQLRGVLSGSLLGPTAPQSSEVCASSPASQGSTLTTTTLPGPLKMDSVTSFPWVPERVLVQSWHRRLTDTYRDYSMVNVVGEGQNGAVFIVQHKRSGRRYACKLLSKVEHFPSAMRREIDLLRRLDHPCVVRLHETNEDKDAVFLLMELCRGGDLFSRIARGGRLSEDIARAMAEQMLQALAYIHSMGVVHMDVKPENFLMESEDPSSVTLKLADFGIAQTVGDGRWPSDGAAQVHGSIPYMPPEAFAGLRGQPSTRRVKTAWDIWSCGVVIYVMLSGDLPYGECIEAICSGQPPDFSGEAWQEVSAEAINLICGLLNPNAEARWTARRALGHAWLRGPGAGAGPPPADAAARARFADGAWGSALSTHELAHRLLRDLQRWRKLPKLQRIAIAAIARRLDADHPSMRLAQAAWSAFNAEHDKLRCGQLVKALQGAMCEAAAAAREAPEAPPEAEAPGRGPTLTGLHLRRRVRGALRRRFSRLPEDTPSSGSPFARSPGSAPLGGDDLAALTAELEYLVDSLDGAKDGAVDYTLLVAAVLPPEAYRDEARIAEVFEMFDIKKRGKITADDLQTYLRSAMKTRDVSLRRFSEMIAEFDLNGDDALDREEFRTMLQRRELEEEGGDLSTSSCTPLTESLTPDLGRLSPGLS